MRELRFRAWDEHCEDMTFSDQSCGCSTSEYVWDIGIETIECKRVDLVTENYSGNCNQEFELFSEGMSVAMQFTGLYDCNKVPIYESDILVWFLQDRKKIAEVEFDVNYGHWIAKDKRLNYYVEAINFPLCEVIGNIYEHGDLL